MEPTRITLVTHTHWDREWYRPFDEFLKRLVAMMDTLIELADHGFPHFHLDGQTAMIDDYLAVRPEREADVRRLVAAGRLSVGPWVTQMDEFLVSGESLIRNLEQGLARARELGPALEVGYLPDQFGHVGQMPQILRQAGIERAVVWRGVPRSIDKTAFRWESPDGSSVLTEYLAFGYFLGARLSLIREPDELADAIAQIAARVAPYIAGLRMLVMVGSDHSGPDVSLPHRVAEARHLLPGIEAEVGSLSDHLHGAAPEGLPTWRGELRSSARAHLLPNVYSARIRQKQERARVEALLERYAEPLAALVPGFEWPAEELDRAWELLLWNGAHDSVCGCSHDQVARDVDTRHGEAHALAEGVIGRALEALGSQTRTSGSLRFNPSPFERDGVPGLGWRVDPVRMQPGDLPVTVEVLGGRLAADGIEITLKDEPDVGDLYNFCYASEDLEPRAPSWSSDATRDVEAVFDDGLVVRLLLRHREGEPFLRLSGEIDNRRPDHRLRLHVRLPEKAAGAVAGSPFELIERGLVSEGSDLEAPSATWPARGVVTAGGLALFAEGVVEYEIVGGQELAVTILRCVGTISRETLATRPFPAGPDVPTPDAQMIGMSSFALGLRIGARHEDLIPLWERFALPLRSAQAAGGGGLPSSESLLDISGEAALSSIRRKGDALEVRLWNPRKDRPVRASISGHRVVLGPARIETVHHPRVDQAAHERPFARLNPSRRA
ncbi:MAG: hypothetical protein ACT4PO_13660 [Actinomycetota bacterium]